jgi:hypothetical protein
MLFFKQSRASSLSDMLPLGYLYLLVLGLAAESIYYSFLGINFLSYASILDVLLGPIALLTADTSLLFAILILAFFFALLAHLVVWLLKKSPKKQPPPTATQFWALFMAVVIFASFIGYGLGLGIATAKQIKAGDFKPDTRLVLVDGSVKDVHKLGNTSTFFFYIETGKTKPSVAPLSGNILLIEYL